MISCTRATRVKRTAVFGGGLTRDDGSSRLRLSRSRFDRRPHPDARAARRTCLYLPACVRVRAYVRTRVRAYAQDPRDARARARRRARKPQNPFAIGRRPPRCRPRSDRFSAAVHFSTLFPAAAASALPPAPPPPYPLHRPVSSSLRPRPPHPRLSVGRNSLFIIGLRRFLLLAR